VHLSTHYYVLSLSERTNKLYECFRDTVIDVQNRGFPVEPSAPIHSRADSADPDGQLRDLLRDVDRKFAGYYQQEPLKLVVVGEERIQSVFESITVHGDVIIGRVDGDYTVTSPRDVGKIVWPVVKEAMSGFGANAMRDLEIATNANRVALGLDAVGRWAGVGEGSTLLVEEDYHVRGSIQKTDDTALISQDVDVREVVDDVVDAVIDQVLATAGNVLFVGPGSLKKLARIALILRGTEQVP
jgi:hypothetical protein